MPLSPPDHRFTEWLLSLNRRPETMSEGETRAALDEHALPATVRLSDLESPLNLAERDERLALLDSLLEEYIFHTRIIRERWRVNEGLIILLGMFAMILGSWDLGIGELSGGGDYNRVGIFGDESGFLHIADLSLIFALLSIIAWVGIFALLWIRSPLMRENLVYMTLATFGVTLGHLSSHANAISFPFDATANDWAGVGIGNLVLLFLSIIVVHKAVIETRDIHVQERHAHPDPRVVQKAWRDHSLKVWSLSLGAWMILINITAWAGAHAVAPRPPLTNDMTLFVTLHVLSGIAAIAVWTHVLWYPQFMLGASADRIQSIRAREVAGEIVPQASKRRQGRCPICDVDTAAVKHADGIIEVPCGAEGCDGRGMPGAACPDCEALLPTRIGCLSCGSNTTVASHFTRAEAW